MKPGYLAYSLDELQGRAQKALHVLESCRLCPRRCEINRLEGKTGVCQTGRWAPVASYHLHFGEENPLVGDSGSGTIFFAGCNLGCDFCQNHEISHNTLDAPEAEPRQIAALMLELQRMGALNINFVTPTHVVPQILEALLYAVQEGLRLPLVYNCGGYEEVDTLGLLEGIVDIYMPDLKFSHPEVAKRLARAEDYPEKAKSAVKEMHRQVGDLQKNDRGEALRGLIVRHLLLPGDLAGTRDWLEFLSREVSTGTYINLMGQYHPSGEARRHPDLCSTISEKDMEQARQEALGLGLKRLEPRERPSLRALLKRL